MVPRAAAARAAAAAAGRAGRHRPAPDSGAGASPARCCAVGRIGPASLASFSQNPVVPRRSACCVKPTAELPAGKREETAQPWRFALSREPTILNPSCLCLHSRHGSTAVLPVLCRLGPCAAGCPKPSSLYVCGLSLFHLFLHKSQFCFCKATVILSRLNKQQTPAGRPDAAIKTLCSCPAGGPRLRLPPPEDLVHALAMAAGFVQHLLDSNPELTAAVAAGVRVLSQCGEGSTRAHRQLTTARDATTFLNLLRS